MRGGHGNDFFYIDNVGDVAIEAAGEGRDTIYAGVDFTLAAGQEIEVLRAWAGTPGAMAGLSLTGNASDNTIVGSTGNDTLIGDAGNDKLNGGAGADVMTGGIGDDTYYVDHFGDQVFEAVGGGKDILYSKVDFTLAAGQEIEVLRAWAGRPGAMAGLSLTGNAFDNTIVGSTGNDTLIGDAGNDRLNGGVGVDVMTGGTGDDTYYIDNFADQVFEAIGGGKDILYSTVDYTLGAGQEVETLRVSGTVGLALTGNELDNTLIGGAGNDRLQGGGGNDILKGGAGADTFVFAAGLDGTARIIDFQRGVDVLEVNSAMYGGGLVAGVAPHVLDAASAGAAAAPADWSGGHFILDSAGAGRGTLYWDATGGSGADAIAIATLQGISSLSANDFLIV